MNIPLYSDVILLRNVPNEGLRAGEIGTVVEFHNIEGLEQGCSVEFFDTNGTTIAVLTLPMNYFQSPTGMERLREDS